MNDRTELQRLDLKILANHPVQYQAPLFRELTESGLNISVGYYHQGMVGQKTFDPDFGANIEWDIDLLTGYPHRFFLQKAKYNRYEQFKISPQLFFWALRDRKTPLLLIGWFVEIVWVIWLIRVVLRMPVMTLEDNTLLSYSLSSRPHWRESLLKWLLCNSSAHLYVGARNREFLESMGVQSKQLFYTPHSIDNVRFATQTTILLPQRRSLCKNFSLDPDLPTFMFCGKLIPIKQPLQLLEAYFDANLKDCAQLIYIGEGMFRNEIEEMVRNTRAKNVHILGFFNQTQMPLAYVLGEILCVPSISETWGLAVNEAFACGRPVIISKAAGCVPDLVSPSTGWIIPKSDHESLVHTLQQAYEKRDLWTQMGMIGQQQVSNHTYATMVKGIRSALVTI
jgi:glycosyltransferase involved in cell wall biosynthesis